MPDIILTPSDFVAVLNQTLEYAYPIVSIVGELSNFKVSKNKWVYFDLKDDTASVKFFGTIYSLPGPLEDGLVLQVTGQPRLNPLYGFSITVQSITAVGEGSLKRAADLLMVKLNKEGLFDPTRKRELPYAPASIGLIASKESAAYADFMKILNSRWGGVHIIHADVQVQGEPAVSDVVRAIEMLNQHAAPEVIVITRGGGSADDLAAFNSEQITRAVAGSRIPTLVAIGHESDICLAELAADQRASTPSNAAELLVPDKKSVISELKSARMTIRTSLRSIITMHNEELKAARGNILTALDRTLTKSQHSLSQQAALLAALNPMAILSRGFSIIRSNGEVVSSVKSLKPDQKISIEMHDGTVQGTIS